MTTAPRLTFLLDVDNTLLDNDGAKAEIGRLLRGLIGDRETERFWQCYEEVRAADGVVSYPLTLVRFWQDAPPAKSEDAERRRVRDALADTLMAFPYQRFVYPGALSAIANVASLGRATIFSDGDPTYQPSKIIRSGLGAAVAGYVLVYAHKAEHLLEVTTAFPADRYVLVDDNPKIITAMRQRMRAPLTTVFVHQGKYARTVGPGPWPGADMTLESIAQLQACDLPALLKRNGNRDAEASGGSTGSR